jgi:hypothetical protein
LVAHEPPVTVLLPDGRIAAAPARRLHAERAAREVGYASPAHFNSLGVELAHEQRARLDTLTAPKPGFPGELLSMIPRVAYGGAAIDGVSYEPTPYEPTPYAPKSDAERA